MKKYNIAVIGGEGIGPEVIGETIILLKATELEFKFSYAEGGYEAYKNIKHHFLPKRYQPVKNVMRYYLER